MPASRLLFLALPVVTALALACPGAANAWGRRGHQIVGGVAANLVAETDPANAFIRGHGYDLAYYGNVPDIGWKKPETYKVEWTNHFMDMEIFERELKSPNGGADGAPFMKSRAEFDAAYPKIAQDAGRAWWRIRELDERLGEIAGKLRALPAEAPRSDRQKLQEEWLVAAGVLGHYFGDLSQPLHCTENYDGQLSEQKGVHAFYEDKVLDELYPDIEADAMKIARAKRKSYAASVKGKSTLEIAQALTEASKRDLPKVLALDKKLKRDLKKAAVAFRPEIAERLAAGALATAEIWRRRLGWTYDGEKFYAFDAKPAYVYPPGAEPGLVRKPDPTPTPGIGAASPGH